MTEQAPEVAVVHNADLMRYEAYLDGELAGFTQYNPVGDVLVFDHTETSPEFGGRGVGSALVRGALDAVAAEGGRRVEPTCTFVSGWIDGHPDYHHLLRSTQPPVA